MVTMAVAFATVATNCSHDRRPVRISKCYFFTQTASGLELTAKTAGSNKLITLAFEGGSERNPLFKNPPSNVLWTHMYDYIWAATEIAPLRRNARCKSGIVCWQGLRVQAAQERLQELKLVVEHEPVVRAPVEWICKKRT